MFGSLFDLDKPFWRWMGRIPQILILSLCFYLCCIPVITIMPAACALFDAISRCTVPDETGCYKRFFRTFRNELKKGIPLTIFWILIAIFAVFADQILTLNAATNDTIAIFLILYRIMLISTVAYLCWLIPLESRYYHKFLQLHVNALSFYFGSLPGTALMLFMTASVVILSIAHPLTYCLLPFVPGLIAVLHTFPIEKAFKKAFPEDYETLEEALDSE